MAIYRAKREAWNTSFPHSPQKEPTPITSNLQSSSIHDCEIRNFCCKAVRHTVHLPMQEMLVPSLGQEDPLEEETATASRILAWRIPRTEGPGGLQATGSQGARHNSAAEHTCAHSL